ncbi:unnamed protein product, partial [marine sediment metagenome]
GFHNLQKSKDAYLDIKTKKTINHDLINKFIKIQIILLSPICPYLCDYIWTELFPKEQMTYPDILNYDRTIGWTFDYLIIKPYINLINIMNVIIYIFIVINH